MQYIRDTYNVPAKRGMIIGFNRFFVKILSAKNGKLRVQYCGEDNKTLRYYIHPTWRVDYPKEPENE